MIAAFGVILIHVKPGVSLANDLTEVFWVFTVSFFYLVSLRFFWASLRRKSTTKLLSSLCYRLVIPYASWTLIYLLLWTLKVVIVGSEVRFNPWGAVFYGQTAVHLYYLPTLFWLQVTTLTLVSLTRDGANSVRLISLAFLVGFGIFGSVCEFIGWVFLAGLPLFLVTSLLMERFAKTIDRSSFSPVVGTILLVSAAAIRLAGESWTALQFPLEFWMGGLGFYLCSLKFPRVMPDYLVSASFGIYLSHIVFLELGEAVSARLGILQTPYSLPTTIAASLAIFGCGMACTLTIRRIGPLRGILLGERWPLGRTGPRTVFRHA